MRDEVDDLLHEDELEPEALLEAETTDLEAAVEIEEEEAIELEADELGGEDEGEGPAVLAPVEPAEEAEGEDTEAALDEILHRQLEGEEAEGVEEAEAGMAAVAPGQEPVRPRGAEEFVCRSCFLVRRLTLLADAGRTLCRDCADGART